MPGVYQWWLRHPERWHQELEAFTAAGWSWTVDAATAERGMIAVRVRMPIPSIDRPTAERPDAGDPPALAPAERYGHDEDETVGLVVRYPVSYPFFPPAVYDQELRLDLPRHRTPVSGHLCLVHARDWDVDCTAARLLASQLPRLLRVATTTDPVEAAGLEVPAPEPVGHHTVDRVGARIIVDGGWQIPPQVQQGVMVLGLGRLRSGVVGPGFVKQLQAGEQILDSLAAPLGELFGLAVPGRWIRCPDYRPGMTAADLWQRVEPTLAPLQVFADTAAADQPDQVPVQVPTRQLEGLPEVIGLLVPSEITYRQPNGQEWLFLVRSHPEGKPEPVTELFHSVRAGPADVAVRSPATLACRDRRALVVGVGAIGSTVAVELARAGIGTLDLVDGDYADPATGCRQLAPMYLAGVAKTVAVQAVLAEQHPYTTVHAHQVRLGAAQITHEGRPDPHTEVLHLAGHADLVIDAAADPAVSRYLGAVSVATQTALLVVSSTAGGHGGVVALLPPQAEACWWCLLHHRHDGSLPVPPAATGPDATVTPAGCAEPTFTGTSADLATVATHAARIALGHLTGEIPVDRARVYVAALRDSHGRFRAVRWRTRTLTRHPACPAHGGSRRRTERPTAGPPDDAEAAIASPGSSGTVTTAAGDPANGAAAARTLTSQQSKQSKPAAAPPRRGGG